MEQGSFQGAVEPYRRYFIYIKVSIGYLNTFILGCGLSLVMGRPDRPVAVIGKARNIHGISQKRYSGYIRFEL